MITGWFKPHKAARAILSSESENFRFLQMCLSSIFSWVKLSQSTPFNLTRSAEGLCSDCATFGFKHLVCEALTDGDKSVAPPDRF